MDNQNDPIVGSGVVAGELAKNILAAIGAPDLRIRSLTFHMDANGIGILDISVIPRTNAVEPLQQAISTLAELGQLDVRIEDAAPSG